jgi:renalase
MKTGGWDVLIVGAGISGLMAAQQLTAVGISVALVDKGRSPGGRLATRRIGPGQADHGAQFFTVRTAIGHDLVTRWLREELIFEWSRGWSDGSLESPKSDGYPRYAVHGGFNALAKHLAQDLDVQLSIKLKSVAEGNNGRWLAIGENGERFECQAIVLTPPVPQSLALLDNGHFEMPASERRQLEAIEYAPCLCGMFLVDGEIALPEPGAFQRPSHAISWIADNLRKGISPEGRVLTVHAGPDSSHAHWPDSDESILTWMNQEIEPLLSPGAVVRENQLKRWRYALPVRLHPDRFLSTQSGPLLYFAGDAFHEPRVEGAMLSGLAVAEDLIGRFGY